ncbi:hypothetical protein BDV59DRAFT_203620 [Aspergillus ambiguus]|uniref:Gfo/Idh/MocA family protein n=1 Tax=Aspergillus ambiguus TaxID=176160 RepID=UPI003CCC91FB
MAGIALLGAGLFVKEAHLPALIEHKANLRAVYSRSSASAQSLVSLAKELGVSPTTIATYADDDSQNSLSSLLIRPDIQAVIIALPITVQPAVVRQCLAAGKHVLCEKPLAADIKIAADLIHIYETTYKNQGTMLAIAEQFRLDRAFTLARTLASTRIGKVTHVHARVWSNINPSEDPNRWFETQWRKIPEYQGGFVLDAGVHFVALIRYVSGLEIVETASLTTQVHDYLPPLDTVNAALRFENGVAGSVSISFSSRKQVFEFSFVGENGSVLILGSKNDGESIVVLEDVGGTVLSQVAIQGKGVSEEVGAFLEGVRNGQMDERLDPRQAYADLAVIQSLCEGGGLVSHL